MLKLSELRLVGSKEELKLIPDGKVLINTINAHCYNVAQKDPLYAEALRTDGLPFTVYGLQDSKDGQNGNVNGNGNQTAKLYDNVNANLNLNENENKNVDVDVEKVDVDVHVEVNKFLIPDGASIIKACRWLKAKSQPKERIAGWDLFSFEMKRLNGTAKLYDNVNPNVNENDNVNLNPNLNLNENENKNVDVDVEKVDVEKVDVEVDVRKRVMFMGSSEKVLGLIRERCKVDYPNLEVVTYSPPYKPEFSEEENNAIIQAINDANPDLLWIGMTAPKQEKWTWQHWNELNIHCHVGTIGAVFDFYAGTAMRAPMWWQKHGLEWLYRLIKEPKRMWRRYVIGNPLFIWNVIMKG